jgi:RNA polymerase sigma-70 factor (ECF subfamily)
MCLVEEALHQTWGAAVEAQGTMGMGNLHDFGPVAGSTDATSLSLLERVKAQDEGAWQRLVYLYSPLVFSWCRRSGLGSEDSSDIVQEVFAAVVSNIARFHRERPGDTFRGWLRVIARNKIHLHFRNEADRPQAAGGTAAQIHIQHLADQPLNESAPLTVDDTEEFRDLIHWGVELVRGSIEERTWQAFWMCAVEQRSSVEVAASLGMTPVAVRQAKHRVLRRLRGELGELLQ